VATFDNKTYGYDNLIKPGCKHLLFKDCSGGSPVGGPVPVAISQAKEADKTIVEMLTGAKKVELVSQDGQGEVVVKVDGQTQSVPAGGEIEMRDGRGRVVLTVYRYRDGVVSAGNPRQLVYVYFDGRKAEIVAPVELFKDRACGLCGDNNGEYSADVRTPRRCVVSCPQYGAYSYADNKQTCPFPTSCGSVRGDRAEYERELQECAKRHVVPTRVEPLARRIVEEKTYLVAMANVRPVEETPLSVCIGKRAALSCPPGHYPSKLRSVRMPFVCLVKGSFEAAAWRARAEAGATLGAELAFAKPSYSQTMLEPVKCVKHENPNAGSFSPRV